MDATPNATFRSDPLNHIPGLGSILRLSPADPDKRIRAGLFLLGGLTIGDLADALSYRRDYLSLIIHNDKISNIARRAIAEFIGVEVCDIWPAASGDSADHGSSLDEAAA